MEATEKLIKSVLTTPNNTNRQVVEGQLATIVRKIQGEAAEQVENAKIKCFKMNYSADTDSGLAFMDDTPYRDFFQAIIDQEFFYVVPYLENGDIYNISGYYYPTCAEIVDAETGAGHFVLQRTYSEDLVENGVNNVYVEGMDILAEDFDNVKIEWNDRHAISDGEYEISRPHVFKVNYNNKTGWTTSPNAATIAHKCAEGCIMHGYVQDDTTNEIHALHQLAGKNSQTFTFYYDDFNDNSVQYTRNKFTFDVNSNVLSRENNRAYALPGYLAIGANAAVGKIPCVNEMNSSGNTSLPRSWVFIDPPKSENPWELISTFQVVSDTDDMSGFSLFKDSNGERFELKKAILICEYPKYTGSSNIPVMPQVAIVSASSSSAIPSGTLGIPSKTTKTIGYYEIELNGNLRIEKGFQKEASDDTDIFSDNFSITLDNVREYKVVNNSIKSITELGIYDCLTYAGCKFALYGVRI